MQQIIDVKQIIKNKNPKLFNILPTPIINYIKQIVHQEEFNEFLIKNKNKFNHDFVRESISHFKINLSSIGLENIPISEGCIIACNHPLGGLDGIAVMNEVGKVRKDLKALVNDILMNIENLSELLIPINKHGKNSIKEIRQIDSDFASDKCVIVFPAGLVSRKIGGKIQDLEWKKSFISKAIKHKKMVIPVFIDAKNSNFFYNLSIIRNALFIKNNIEMFFLVDEVFKQSGKSIKITFGKPISYLEFTKEFSHNIWANKVKDKVYSLKSDAFLK